MECDIAKFFNKSIKLLDDQNTLISMYDRGACGLRRLGGERQGGRLWKEAGAGRGRIGMNSHRIM